MTTLTFTDDQLAVIDQALGQLPYRLAAPLVANINQQIAEARAALPPVETEESA